MRMRDACVNADVHSPSGLAGHECVADSSRRVADARHAFVFCLVCSQQKCAQVPGMEGVAYVANYASYFQLLGIAIGCGHPASTVKVTPPALDSCEGAYGKYTELYGATCPFEKVVDGDEQHTPASCGNAECAKLISSIDDNALACWKKGLQVSIMTMSVFESVSSVCRMHQSALAGASVNMTS